MLSVRTAGMDETIRAVLYWNKTKARTLGTCLEQRAAPGAKMSLYHQSWRFLQLFFATITAVLTQGKCPGSNWLCVVLYLNLNCPSGMSVNHLMPKRSELTWSLLGRSLFKHSYCVCSVFNDNSWKPVCHWMWLPILCTCYWSVVGPHSAMPCKQ